MSERTIINAIHEYNDKGHLIYADNYIGAYVRGRTLSEALAKFPAEINRYNRWLCKYDSVTMPVVNIAEEYSDVAGVEDADSYVIFESEKAPLTAEEYLRLKALALKSAEDFLYLYNSIPNKYESSLQPRKTFYGNVPITVEEMYRHTKNVNSYYFAEINIDVGNEPNIVTCRAAGFELLEATPCFLDNPVYHGSYDEDWSLRKVIRRFVWHDRIHARAMYRMATSLCGRDAIEDQFCFG